MRATLLIIAGLLLVARPAFADRLDEALGVLAQAKPDNGAECAAAWKIAAAASVDDLPRVLSALPADNLLGQNWIRNAADAVIEKSGKVPTAMLITYATDTKHPSRARRVAYEWAATSDATAAAELLPKFANDPDLELRYDAVAAMISQAEKAEGDARKKLLREAFESARDPEQLSTCVTALDKLGEKADITAQMGYLTKWQVIGPFDNTGGEGFAVVYPPETDADLKAKFAGKSGEVAWKELVTAEERGLVDLAEPFEKVKGAVIYASAIVSAPKAMEADLRYCTPNGSKLWLNGEPVASSEVYHSGGENDQYIVPVKLKAGENRVLLKVCQNEQKDPWAQAYQFQLRVCDSLGGKIAGVTQ